MVIFDWDGTLCDSVSQIVRAVQAVTLEMGLPVPSEAEAANIIGLSLPRAMEVLFPQEPPERLALLIEGYASHYVGSETAPPALFPGALETLHELRGRGFALAVATGKSRRGLDRMLARLGLEDLFDATRCADETRSKPDPLMVTELLAERGCRPQDVIMVGDTEYDLEMARNAGVASVGVSFGVHSIERLARHAPLAIVDELPALLDLPALSGSRF
ncbi:HAD family hydrolase [Seongchinamella unica]|uniref:HAD family hydrolase n=1 Tax=Seongchinamella unica TaxID=2547392 RepID=A0A4R5LT12_9GAMM|nr:HAD-IA family hydrolase [Seongchinamella unica]TDG14041.1 HAD family hydrolase [Seongchinamella unica]